MGISFYFSWLIRHFEKRIITERPPFETVHQLYLDFNCAIHPVARSHVDYSIEKMCDNIIVYLEYLINYVKPTELVYVAIDGVAPAAKIKQQRLRRYKSIKETYETKMIKQQFGMPVANDQKDFNMISPATEFMSILSSKMDLFFRQHHSVKVIFSDSSVPSEGEHKILQHIKRQPSDKNCVIYGLDSDLIMLSLCTHRDNLVLVRENNLIKNNNVDVAIDKFPELNYFLVSELKKILFTILISNQEIELFTRNDTLDLSSQINLTSLYDQIVAAHYDIERIIRDYIFMSFLLGNDFIPSFPTLKIRTNGIEKIIQAYRQTIKNDGQYFCNEDMSINVSFLSKFIGYLAIDEEDSFKRQKQAHDRHLNMRQTTTPMNFTEAMDQYQQIEHLYRDHINAYESGWQDQYYQYFFHIKTDNICRQAQIDHVCADYIVALQWIMRYYFDRCHDWYWFYPHEATPLLSDFQKYINSHTNQINLISFVHNQPVKPYHQLLMILPPQSAHLLPSSLRTYMLSDQSPLIYYYPIDFELEYYGKKYRWESHPKIPIIDPNEISLGLNHIDQLLTSDERSRGQFGQIREY